MKCTSVLPLILIIGNGICYTSETFVEGNPKVEIENETNELKTDSPSNTVFYSFKRPKKYDRTSKENHICSPLESNNKVWLEEHWDSKKTIKENPITNEDYFNDDSEVNEYFVRNERALGGINTIYNKIVDNAERFIHFAGSIKDKVFSSSEIDESSTSASYQSKEQFYSTEEQPNQQASPLKNSTQESLLHDAITDEPPNKTILKIHPNKLEKRKKLYNALSNMLRTIPAHTRNRNVSWELMNSESMPLFATSNTVWNEKTSTNKPKPSDRGTEIVLSYKNMEAATVMEGRLLSPKNDNSILHTTFITENPFMHRNMSYMLPAYKIMSSDINNKVVCKSYKRESPTVSNESPLFKNDKGNDKTLFIMNSSSNISTKSKEENFVKPSSTLHDNKRNNTWRKRSLFFNGISSYNENLYNFSSLPTLTPPEYSNRSKRLNDFLNNSNTLVSSLPPEELLKIPEVNKQISGIDLLKPAYYISHSIKRNSFHSQQKSPKINTAINKSLHYKIIPKLVQKDTQLPQGSESKDTNASLSEEHKCYSRVNGNLGKSYSANVKENQTRSLVTPDGVMQLNTKGVSSSTEDIYLLHINDYETKNNEPLKKPNSFQEETEDDSETEITTDIYDYYDEKMYELQDKSFTNNINKRPIENETILDNGDNMRAVDINTNFKSNNQKEPLSSVTEINLTSSLNPYNDKNAQFKNVCSKSPNRNILIKNLTNEFLKLTITSSDQREKDVTNAKRVNGINSGGASMKKDSSTKPDSQEITETEVDILCPVCTSDEVEEGSDFEDKICTCTAEKEITNIEDSTNNLFINQTCKTSTQAPTKEGVTQKSKLKFQNHNSSLTHIKPNAEPNFRGSHYFRSTQRKFKSTLTTRRRHVPFSNILNKIKTKISILNKQKASTHTFKVTHSPLKQYFASAKKKYFLKDYEGIDSNDDNNVIETGNNDQFVRNQLTENLVGEKESNERTTSGGFLHNFAIRNSEMNCVIRSPRVPNNDNGNYNIQSHADKSANGDELGEPVSSFKRTTTLFNRFLSEEQQIALPYMCKINALRSDLDSPNSTKQNGKLEANVEEKSYNKFSNIPVNLVHKTNTSARNKKIKSSAVEYEDYSSEFTTDGKDFRSNLLFSLHQATHLGRLANICSAIKETVILRKMLSSVYPQYSNVTIPSEFDIINNGLKITSENIEAENLNNELDDSSLGYYIKEIIEKNKNHNELVIKPSTSISFLLPHPVYSTIAPTKRNSMNDCKDLLEAILKCVSEQCSITVNTLSEFNSTSEISRLENYVKTDYPNPNMTNDSTFLPGASNNGTIKIPTSEIGEINCTYSATNTSISTTSVATSSSTSQGTLETTCIYLNNTSASTEKNGTSKTSTETVMMKYNSTTNSFGTITSLKDTNEINSINYPSLFTTQTYVTNHSNNSSHMPTITATTPISNITIATASNPSYTLPTTVLLPSTSVSKSSESPTLTMATITSLPLNSTMQQQRTNYSTSTDNMQLETSTANQSTSCFVLSNDTTTSLIQVEKTSIWPESFSKGLTDFGSTTQETHATSKPKSCTCTLSTDITKTQKNVETDPEVSSKPSEKIDKSELCHVLSVMEQRRKCNCRKPKDTTIEIITLSEGLKEISTKKDKIKSNTEKCEGNKEFFKINYPVSLRSGLNKKFSKISHDFHKKRRLPKTKHRVLDLN